MYAYACLSNCLYWLATNSLSYMFVIVALIVDLRGDDQRYLDK